MALKYSRILLKLSGEFFIDSTGQTFSMAKFDALVAQLKVLSRLGVQIGLVIGGGNLIRGTLLTTQGLDNITSDYMGMLATVINGLALRQHCHRCGLPVVLMSLLTLPQVVANYDVGSAIMALQQGKVVIFAGGTGHPLCTTDSAASERARDIHADILLKATKVDGIYSLDPKQYTDAKRYTKLSYHEVIEQKLAVMDLAAFRLCQQYRIPIRVFNMRQTDGLLQIIKGADYGTLVS